MKNILKKNLKLFIGFIFGIIIASGVAYAAIVTSSDKVMFTPSNTSWNVNNVQSALNSLYQDALNNYTRGYNDGKSSASYQTQTRNITYHANGNHGSADHTGTVCTNTTSGTGTWFGGRLDTRWTSDYGDFSFPHELLGIKSISGSSDYTLTISGQNVKICEHFNGVNDSKDGVITIVAVGW